MLPTHVRRLILTYLGNIVGRPGRWKSYAKDVMEWLDAEHADLLGIDAIKHQLHLPGDGHGSLGYVPASTRERLQQAVDAASQGLPATARDHTARRLDALRAIVGIDDNGVAVLELLLRYRMEPFVEDFVDSVFSGPRRHHSKAMNLSRPTLSALLDMPAGAVARQFASDAPLIRSGLVYVEDDQDIECVQRLYRLASEMDRRSDVRELLLGGVQESELEWSDFEHLGQGRDDVERLLRGALREEARGVNVLLYGPPGTGKTEFCRVLAERLGVALFSVGEDDGDGDEPSRRGRLNELRLAQSLLGNDPRALLLFDEMDDLLSGVNVDVLELGFRASRAKPGANSKVFMNRLLEQTRTPTIWTTNVAGSINPAFLRRMMFALEMRQPPPRIRSRIWSRQLARHGIEASDDDAAALAREFDATPGVAAGATAAARLGAGDFDTVRRGVRSLSRLLGCERPQATPQVRFATALIETNLDVDVLAERLESSRQRRFSLCLQGPPGTGKSAYVRYLADRLGLEVMQKRTSDLISMWVGQSERNIAAAFAEARDEQAFLVFDEADSLLADRRGAHRHWEVSQVNEMLTWMESHPLPFACTTNFGEALDSAALRRFVFKATLGYLKPRAAAEAFRVFFGKDAPPEVGAMRVLTPGDFEVVRRKATVLGQTRDAEALVAMLRTECDAKPDQAGAVGFGA
ncbi:MAG: AAA family ATPase [Gammaproteobacteria bacterium]|nr:AAA family ATPase [Gammaproteobacteria bacterium]MYB39478.1 AAA family ATPase [Gammaproteobacteria bacterium]